MKKSFKIMLGLVAALVISVAVLSGCGENSNVSPSPDDSLTSLDFGTMLAAFPSGSSTTAYWDRTNIIQVDTTTCATIDAPHGENNPVIMIKGNSGTMTATSTDSGTLDFDPAQNSQYGSVLMMQNGQTAQMGDGIFQFSMRLSAPYQDPNNAQLWNTQVIFRFSTPNAMLTDSAVTSALAIQATNGGDIQLVQNGNPSVNVINDTGVNISDGNYHYFIIGMQDVSGGTSVKLWIDGNAVYSGVVTGLASTGAIQIYNNSTPQYDADGNALVTNGVGAGTFAALTACGETYIGGYAPSGPAVNDLSLN